MAISKQLTELIYSGIPAPVDSTQEHPVVAYLNLVEERLAALEEGGEEEDGEDGGSPSHDFVLTGFGDVTVEEGAEEADVLTGSLVYTGTGFTGTMTLVQLTGQEGGVEAFTSGNNNDIVNVPLGLDWDAEDSGDSVPLDVELLGTAVGEYSFVLQVAAGSEILFTSEQFTVTVAPAP